MAITSAKTEMEFANQVPLKKSNILHTPFKIWLFNYIRLVSDKKGTNYLNEQNLTFSIDQSKVKELLEKLSRATELIEELGELLDSIKETKGLFKA